MRARVRGAAGDASPQDPFEATQLAADRRTAAKPNESGPAVANRAIAWECSERAVVGRVDLSSPP